MHKNRIINKYTILSFLLFFGISFLSWGIQSDYFINLFFYVESPEYSSRDDYFYRLLNFEDYIILGFSFLQILLPIIVSLSVMNFVDERSGLFPYAYPRAQKYQKFLLSSIFEHAAVSSMAILLAFILYILAGCGLVGKFLFAEHELYGRDLFADVLGTGFYYNHPVIYYALESIMKYMIFPFIYSLFTMAVAFYTEKKYLIISIPTVYYLVLTVIFQCIPAIPEPNYFDFSIFAPTFPLVAQGAIMPSTALVGVSYIPVIAFVVVTLVRNFKNEDGEKLGV